MDKRGNKRNLTERRGIKRRERIKEEWNRSGRERSKKELN